VWDHRPTADEMLDDRLARGWVPTPTGTVDGPVILGHANHIHRCGAAPAATLP
jgi:hypothetical protein